MNSKLKDIFNFILAVIVIVIINYLCSFRFFRKDLTNDQLHSLSTKTIHFLENEINDEVTVDVYLDGDFPAEIQKLKNSLTEKLNEFKAYAGTKLKIRFHDLNEDEELKEDFKKEIYSEGIDPSYIFINKDATEQNSIEIWPGVLLKQGDKTVAVQLLQGGNIPINQQIINRFSDQLEFKFIQGLLKLTTNKVKNISFLRGHNELNNAEIYDIRHKLMEFYSVDTIRISQLKTEFFNQSVDSANKKWAGIISSNKPSVIIENDTIDLYDENGVLIDNIDNNLKRYFQTKQLSLFKQNSNNFSEDLGALDNSDGLIVAKPKLSFSEKEKFVIDQFIMKGGKVFWLVDRMDVKEYLLKDSSFVMSETIETKLEDFITTYGARINSDLITDLQCAPVKRIDGMGNLIKWYFYPILSTVNPNEFNLNVGPVRLKYASSVDTFGHPEITKAPLLQTSSNYLKKRQFRVTYKDLTASNPEMFDSPEGNLNQTMGLLLTGKFTSNYKNRGVSDDFKKFLKSSNFKEISDTINSMVVFGDGDFIRNDLILNKETGKYQPLYLDFEAADLGTPNFAPIYGNSVFFLNLVDKLLGNDILIPLRSRMKIPRLLSIEEIKINRKYWQFINLFTPSFLIILMGLLILFFKRRKYN
ncbi:MAG: Gldg family protein [Flavobacteriales bacterium]|nr:Gldg family protein [Flavobacteriales bacterium]